MPDEAAAALTISFFGEQYEIADKIGLMPLMDFAEAARSGGDSSEMDGLLAMRNLIAMCLSDKDWDRFRAAASKQRASGEELMAVVSEVFEVLADRPTQRPADSSDGPLRIEPSSTSTPADRAIAQLDGRPDLQLFVVRAQESMTA